MTGQLPSGLICTEASVEYLAAAQPFPNETDGVKVPEVRASGTHRLVDCNTEFKSNVYEEWFWGFYLFLHLSDRSMIQ